MLRIIKQRSIMSTENNATTAPTTGQQRNYNKGKPRPKKQPVVHEKSEQRSEQRSECLEKDKPKCSICRERNTEISMPCAGMHSYCFTCVKDWMVSNKKELTCPECRKVCDNIIKLPLSKEKISNEFTDFLESVKIIPNPLKHDEDCKCFQTYFDNTCVYPSWTLIHYVENKDQLELYYDTIKTTKFKDNSEGLSKLIKWNIVSDDEDRHSHRRHHA